MFAARILAVGLLSGAAMHAQSSDAGASLEARAASLRAAIAAAPRLPIEQIPLGARMTDPALKQDIHLGTVSSVALSGTDGRGTMYVLQRGDQADPVIAVNAEGRVVRSWGQGMFTVPHSIRIDPEGNIWTV